MRQRKHSHAWRDRAFRRGLGSAGMIFAGACGVIALALMQGEVFASRPVGYSVFADQSAQPPV